MKEGVLLKNYTTMRCGGEARYWDEPTCEEDIIRDLLFASERGLGVFVLGGGANCLISDKGYDGLVIKMGKEMSGLETEDLGDRVIVRAGAGLLLRSFATTVSEMGLEGAEFACGIPGTLGGAVFMNAGAYGGEMKDIVISARYIDSDGNANEISSDDLRLGYRTSIFEQMSRAGKVFVITSVTCELRKGDIDSIKAKISELNEKRTLSQPLDVPSSGSTFKRPEGCFAGKLIDDCGLRGYSIASSAAQVSPKHCGFIVNNGGNASASEVFDLICDVSDKVYEKFGVRLETEVRLVGEFSRRIDITSFGFKYGVPEDCDLVLDARSLKNPYWVEELRPLSGLDEPIRQYLAGFEETERLIAGFVDSVENAISQKNKAVFSVAVGCTGGHHRSVYCASRLEEELRKLGYKTDLKHRDILKDSADDRG